MGFSRFGGTEPIQIHPVSIPSYLGTFLRPAACVRANRAPTRSEHARTRRTVSKKMSNPSLAWMTENILEIKDTGVQLIGLETIPPF